MFSKYIQRRFYNYLNSWLGFTAFLAICALVVFEIGKLCFNSDSVSTTPRYNLRQFEDNIVLSNLQKHLNHDSIDIVYTWVNGSDPRWKLKKDIWAAKLTQNNLDLNEHSFSASNSTNSSDTLQMHNDTLKQGNNSTAEMDDTMSSNRYRDSSELRFSIRSLVKNAPWVRHIYIVTDNQIPHWLNLETTQLSIVTHEEIFPNKSHLPVFSSPAIESHLHRIPGLSKKFIYFNDDVFLGAKTLPEDFITLAGAQKLRMSWDVPKCAPGCSDTWIGDGFCDKACNVSSCNFDYPDCVNSTTYGSSSGSGSNSYHNNAGSNSIRTGTAAYCNKGCPDGWLADKICDQRCKSAECGYDVGDCGLDLVTLEYPGVELNQLNCLLTRSGNEGDTTSTSNGMDAEDIMFLQSSSSISYGYDSSNNNNNDSVEQLETSTDYNTTSTSGSSNTTDGSTTHTVDNNNNNDGITADVSSPDINHFAYGDDYYPYHNHYHYQDTTTTTTTTVPVALTVEFGTYAVYFDLAQLSCQFANSSSSSGVSSTTTTTSTSTTNSNVDSTTTACDTETMSNIIYQKAEHEDDEHKVIHTTHLLSKHHLLVVLLYHTTDDADAMEQPWLETSYRIPFTVVVSHVLTGETATLSFQLEIVPPGSLQSMQSLDALVPYHMGSLSPPPITTTTVAEATNSGAYNSGSSNSGSNDLDSRRAPMIQLCGQNNNSISSGSSGDITNSAGILKITDAHILSTPYSAKITNSTRIYNISNTYQQKQYIEILQEEEEQGAIADIAVQYSYTTTTTSPADGSTSNINNLPAMASFMRPEDISVKYIVTMKQSDVHNTGIKNSVRYIVPLIDALLQYNKVDAIEKKLSSSRSSNNRGDISSSNNIVDSISSNSNSNNQIYKEHRSFTFFHNALTDEKKDNHTISSSTTTADVVADEQSMQHLFLATAANYEQYQQYVRSKQLPYSHRLKQMHERYYQQKQLNIAQTAAAAASSSSSNITTASMDATTVVEVATSEMKQILHTLTTHMLLKLPSPIQWRHTNNRTWLHYQIELIWNSNSIVTNNTINSSDIPIKYNSRSDSVYTHSPTATTLDSNSITRIGCLSAAIEWGDRLVIAATTDDKNNSEISYIQTTTKNIISDITTTVSPHHIDVDSNIAIDWNNSNHSKTNSNTDTINVTSDSSSSNSSKNSTVDGSNNNNNSTTGDSNNSNHNIADDSNGSNNSTAIDNSSTRRVLRTVSHYYPNDIQVLYNNNYLSNQVVSEWMHSIYLKFYTFLYHSRDDNNDNSYNNNDNSIGSYDSSDNNNNNNGDVDSDCSTDEQSSNSRRRRLVDTYAASLIHVNRMYNKAFGTENRKVPAHLPHMIDRDIMHELQSRWEVEWNTTSQNRFRSTTDMQYSFSYYYYLVNRLKVQSPDIEYYLRRAIDTDGNEVLSENELRTLAAVLHPKGGNTASPNAQEIELLLDCMESNSSYRRSYTEEVVHDYHIPTSSRSHSLSTASSSLSSASAAAAVTAGKVYKSFTLYLQPTIQQALNCSIINSGLRKQVDWTQWSPSYTLESDKDIVAFEMIGDDYNETLSRLDSVRARQSKFICINDNMKNPSPALESVLQQFYESFYPEPSMFELPPGVSNPTLYLDEYRSIKKQRDGRKHSETLLLLASVSTEYYNNMLSWLNSNMLQPVRESLVWCLFYTTRLWYNTRMVLVPNSYNIASSSEERYSEYREHYVHNLRKDILKRPDIPTSTTWAEKQHQNNSNIIYTHSILLMSVLVIVGFLLLRILLVSHKNGSNCSNHESNINDCNNMSNSNDNIITGTDTNNKKKKKKSQKE